MNEENQYPFTCPISETAEFTRIHPTKENPKTTKWKAPVHHIEHIDDFLQDTDHRVEEISKELKAGFEAIAAYPKTVTIFGSARFEEDNEYYQKARLLGARCCSKGFAVITGGGPGIMEAANRGTFESCGTAVGFNIVLPHEQSDNEYVTHGVEFQYFMIRKFCMHFAGEAYVFMPGGFGTLDEFFTILTLVQTKKIHAVPMILVGKEFWQPLVDYARTTLLDKHQAISSEDMDLFTVTDDEDEVMRIIEAAPLRGGYYG